MPFIISFSPSCIFLPDSGAFFINYLIAAAFIGTVVQLLGIWRLICLGWRLMMARSSMERSRAWVVSQSYFPILNYLFISLPVNVNFSCSSWQQTRTSTMASSMLGTLSFSAWQLPTASACLWLLHLVSWTSCMFIMDAEIQLGATIYFLQVWCTLFSSILWTATIFTTPLDQPECPASHISELWTLWTLASSSFSFS